MFLMHTQLNFFEQIAKSKSRSLIIMLFTAFVYLVFFYFFAYYIVHIIIYGLLSPSSASSILGLLALIALYFFSLQFLSHLLPYPGAFSQFLTLSIGNIAILLVSVVFITAYFVYSARKATEEINAYNSKPEAPRSKYPSVYNVVGGLTGAFQISMPKIFVAEDDDPNAFALGIDKDNASVTVTTGMLSILDKRELTGVLAHELSHIATGDSKFVMTAFSFSGAVRLISAAAVFIEEKFIEFVALVLVMAYVFGVTAVAMGLGEFVSGAIIWLLQVSNFLLPLAEFLSIPAVPFIKAIFPLIALVAIASAIASLYRRSFAMYAVSILIGMVVTYLIMGFFPPDTSLMLYIIGTAVASLLSAGGFEMLLEVHEGGIIFALATVIYSPIMFVAEIISGVSMIMVGLAISRNREILADSNGARIIRDPHALASALEKIDAYNSKRGSLSAIDIINAKSEEDYTAYLRFNGLDARGVILNLFSTHPPIRKRIEMLMNMH